MMIQCLRDLDGVLRGHKGNPQSLLKGDPCVHMGSLFVGSLCLGVIYGLCMGLYATLTRTPPCLEQLVASAIKVPALFFLTLLVTFPSLYVFGALLGIQLSLKETLRLISISLAVNLAVLASLGPITGFFTLSTTSYPFMKLLNVFFFGVSGVIGLKALSGMLSRLDDAGTTPPPNEQAPGELGESPGALDPGPLSPGQARRQTPVGYKTFRVWLILYALVGAQMGWILRPFIGAPDLTFQWFRVRQSNIFVDVAHSIMHLLSAR
jgi:hypothetical protein